MSLLIQTDILTPKDNSKAKVIIVLEVKFANKNHQDQLFVYIDGLQLGILSHVV